jgi:hypothetical protein
VAGSTRASRRVAAHIATQQHLNPSGSCEPRCCKPRRTTSSETVKHANALVAEIITRRPMLAPYHHHTTEALSRLP